MAAENVMLRQYVSNLLSTAHTTGFDKYGIPIPSKRTSSISRTTAAE